MPPSRLHFRRCSAASSARRPPLRVAAWRAAPQRAPRVGEPYAPSPTVARCARLLDASSRRELRRAVACGKPRPSAPTPTHSRAQPRTLAELRTRAQTKTAPCALLPSAHRLLLLSSHPRSSASRRSCVRSTRNASTKSWPVRATPPLRATPPRRTTLTIAPHACFAARAMGCETVHACGTRLAHAYGDTSAPRAMRHAAPEPRLQRWTRSLRCCYRRAVACRAAALHRRARRRRP
jgi:hypothetical protein